MSAFARLGHIHAIQKLFRFCHLLFHLLHHLFRLILSPIKRLCRGPTSHAKILKELRDSESWAVLEHERETRFISPLGYVYDVGDLLGPAFIPEMGPLERAHRITRVVQEAVYLLGIGVLTADLDYILEHTSLPVLWRGEFYDLVEIDEEDDAVTMKLKYQTIEWESLNIKFKKVLVRYIKGAWYDEADQLVDVDPNLANMATIPSTEGTKMNFGASGEEDGQKFHGFVVCKDTKLLKPKILHRIDVHTLSGRRAVSIKSIRKWSSPINTHQTFGSFAWKAGQYIAFSTCLLYGVTYFLLNPQRQ